MAEFVTGAKGVLKFKPDGGTLKTVAKVRDWSLDVSQDLLSTTVLGDDGQQYCGGFKSATGTATLLYYRDPTNADAKDLANQLINTSSGLDAKVADFELAVDDTRQANLIKFRAYITSIGIQVTSGEITTVPVGFTMEGKFTSGL